MKPTPSVPRWSSQLEPRMIYFGWSICSEEIVMLANDDIRLAQKGNIPVWKLLGVTKRSLGEESLGRGPSR